VDPIALQIAHFTPISLAEMDSVKLQNRVDTKYVFAGRDLPALLGEMQEHYRLLHVDGQPGTAYRSLYFDTADHRHFQDHHNKRTFRNKVRFREYIGSGLTFLEVKRKTGGGRTDKARVKVAGIPEQLSPEQQRYIAEATGRDEVLVPTLWNYFTRYTFVNKARPERLTMDIGLRFADPAKGSELGDIVVAELKQERSDRSSPFVRLMRARGIREAGMSKYCVGMIMLDRPVKHNAFKEVLLRLHRLRQRALPLPMELKR
jgi:hypothetical protein